MIEILKKPSVSIHVLRAFVREVEANAWNSMLQRIQVCAGVPDIWPTQDDLHFGDVLLERFARTSAFARATVSHFICMGGRLAMDKHIHKDNHGRFSSGPGFSGFIMVGNATKTPLRDLFGIIAHELGHAQMHHTEMAVPIRRASILKKHARQRRSLWHSVNRNQVFSATRIKRNDDFIRFFYGSGTYRNFYQGSLEEALVEGFSDIAAGLGKRTQRPRDGAPKTFIRIMRKSVSFEETRKHLKMPLLAFLMKHHFPVNMGLRFSATEKGKLGLKPGKRHRLHPLQSKAFGVPGRRWF